MTDGSGAEFNSNTTADSALGAAVVLSELTVPRPLLAGGDGEVALTVTNPGIATSSMAPLSFSLPPGVAVAGISGSGLGPCVYRLDPGQSVTVIIELAVDQVAQPGDITISADGQERYLWVDIAGQ